VQAVRRAIYGLIDDGTLRRGWPRAINGEKIRFPPRWARYYPSDYQPATQRFLRRVCRPGSTAIDLGAHIGLYTVLLSRYVGETGCVVAFEPMPETRSALQRTLALNRCRNVQVRHEAVADASGRRLFYDTGNEVSNENSLVPLEQATAVLEVPMVSLDGLQLDDVSCLKVDVEGAELDVLEGARELIARWQPVIALDVHPEQLRQGGRSSGDVWDLLHDYGMTIENDGSAATRDWFSAHTRPFDVQALPRR
jgi:FkbM family methyltransferase